MMSQKVCFASNIFNSLKGKRQRSKITFHLAQKEWPNYVKMDSTVIIIKKNQLKKKEWPKFCRRDGYIKQKK